MEALNSEIAGCGDLARTDRLQLALLREELEG